MNAGLYFFCRVGDVTITGGPEYLVGADETTDLATVDPEDVLARALVTMARGRMDERRDGTVRLWTTDDGFVVALAEPQQPLLVCGGLRDLVCEAESIRLVVEALENFSQRVGRDDAKSLDAVTSVLSDLTTFDDDNRLRELVKVGYGPFSFMTQVLDNLSGNHAEVASWLARDSRDSIDLVRRLQQQVSAVYKASSLIEYQHDVRLRLDQGRFVLEASAEELDEAGRRVPVVCFGRSEDVAMSGDRLVTDFERFVTSVDRTLSSRIRSEIWRALEDVIRGGESRSRWPWGRPSKR